jgi:hypothetical protein
MADAFNLATSLIVFLAFLILSWAAVREMPASLATEPAPESYLVPRKNGVVQLQLGMLIPIVSPWIIGSAPVGTIDLHIPDYALAPQHARLWWQGHCWMLERLDFSPAYTVSANDRGVATAQLQSGDLIQIGPYQFELVCR